MDSVAPAWFENHPALLERERTEWLRFGFAMDERALATERVVRFRGRSLYDPKRAIEVRYPDGYPSFAPTVVSPVTEGAPLLNRHHSARGNVLCCFGFADSQWHASMEAGDILKAAERIIRDYAPGLEIPSDDLVPEPRIAHYAYAADTSLMIPLPFGDLSLDQLRRFTWGQLRLRRELGQVSGVVTHLRLARTEYGADSAFLECLPWLAEGQARNMGLRILPEPPPLIDGYGAIVDWLQSIGFKVPVTRDIWTLLVFPDEWGSRHKHRAHWLAIHTGFRFARWVRCYLASRDDQLVRTPFGAELVGRRVLVVGCGSLGSAVAVHLAQEGIGHLVLVDRDVYEPGNAVRHQAAIRLFGRPKVLALRERIRELCPACRVDAIPLSVGKFGSDDGRNRFPIEIGKADIVIDTTGSASVAHYLNDLCVAREKPLIVGSVTNGAWSAEIFRYRPGVSGCRVCWALEYADRQPAGAPRGALQFAPGCDQPTFVGGAADIGVAAGLVARFATETILSPDASDNDYLVWSIRSSEGRWSPRVDEFPVRRHPKCLRCRH